jgi:ribosomal protein S18 acetylase RimI-like enzyme
MSELQIRPAASTDIRQLMWLDHTCESEYVWQLDLRREPEQISAMLRRVRLPRSIRTVYPRDVFTLNERWNHTSLMLAGMIGPDVVGYLCVYEQGSAGQAWVTDLAVGTTVRRRGVASALIRAVESWASERGLRQLYLEASSKNNPAIQMAHKLGYEFCGYNDHYYANQDVALFFGRSIR